MFPRIFTVSVISLIYSSLFAQEKFTITKDLRSEWMTFEEESYQPLGETLFTGLNTIYFELKPNQYPGTFLRLKSDKPYFLFVNGKVGGEFRGEAVLSIDSLARKVYSPGYWIAIHQKNINERDLKTEIISMQRPAHVSNDMQIKPYSDFRDFVVVSGLIIILLFLLALRLNPKLAADYFSVSRIFSPHEAEDSQSGARLTSSSNVQFYILCSLMIGFYLLIILRNLPPQFALPIRFQASGFWMMGWQWLKLSLIIFYVFLLKIAIIFSLTRLFGMRGMARFHFLNWIRLLLVVFGSATIILFIYFISRGDSSEFFVVFLSLVIAALMSWVVVAFFKLSGRSEHSMFHLFSYLCATEIIPLLITVKVLFQ
jgi:hypothetical protein